MFTVHYWYWHSKMVPVPVLAIYIGSVPVWAWSITSTGIQKWCPYWYWHFCNLVQYRYRHSPLPVLAFMVLAFLHFSSVPVYAQSITGTGIQKCCPYWYWKFCTLVQYRYGHIPLPVLAFSCAFTCIGNYVLEFSTSMGTLHYRNWHSIVPVPVLAFLHFGSVPVWARPITGTE
jgi:ABC-type uncharacterized transport system permease subunit